MSYPQIDCKLYKIKFSTSFYFFFTCLTECSTTLAPNVCLINPCRRVKKSIYLYHMNATAITGNTQASKNVQTKLKDGDIKVPGEMTDGH